MGTAICQTSGMAAHPSPDLATLVSRLREFTADRDWEQFHTPRNLLLALVGEVGEVAEILQWKHQVSTGVPELTAEERVHLAEELADVQLYLIRLAEQCAVDLPQAVLSKMVKNAIKYPAP